MTTVVSKKQRRRARVDTPGRDDPKPFPERLYRAGTDFLKIDVETALTFLTVVRSTQDEARRTRNLRAARRAYDTVVRLKQKVTLTDNDEQSLTSRLQVLRSELEGCGEVF